MTRAGLAERIRAFADRLSHLRSLRKPSTGVKRRGQLRRRLRRWITTRVVDFLNQPAHRYEVHHPNDLELLRAHLCKGDVLLVEGTQRISVLIKYLTQSSWSHAALYVGDELVRREGPLRELALEHFGEEAETLVVEALMDGVVASPLSKYVDHHVRICRPRKLRDEHRDVLVEGAVVAIGWRYDLRNVVELAFSLLGISLLPAQQRRRALRFGSGASQQVICTSLIGQLFQDVGFPVLPSITWPDEPARPQPASRLARVFGVRRGRAQRALAGGSAPDRRGVYRRRHATLLTPRDFDLSPFFDVVKVGIASREGFDYAEIRWASEEEGPEPS